MDREELNRLAEKLLNGTASKEEEEILHAWYDRHHSEEGQLFPIHSAASHVDLKNRIRQAIEDQSKPDRILFTVKNWRKIAAIGLILAFISLYYYHRSPEVEWISVSVPLGDREKILLPDSSVAWLNAGTTLRYPRDFVSVTRDVELIEGQAFFEVKPNPTQPFYVQTPTLEVSVLGTSFDVKTYPEEELVSVEVRNGQVGVKIPYSDDVQILDPGYMVLYNKSNSTMELVEKDADYIGAWTDDRITFFNEPIPIVFNALKRKYQVSFITESSEWMDSNLTLKLDQQSLTDILEVMQHIFGIEYRIEEQGKIIRISKQ